MDLDKILGQLRVGVEVSGGGIGVQNYLVGYHFVQTNGGQRCSFVDILDESLIL